MGRGRRGIYTESKERQLLFARQWAALMNSASRLTEMCLHSQGYLEYFYYKYQLNSREIR